MILYFSLAAPHRWAVVDRRDRVVDTGVADHIDGVPLHLNRITRRVAVVPGELATLHALRVPARSRVKAAAAAPYMLEENLADNVDDLEFRLLSWIRGGTSTVAVVSRAVMDQWHETVAGLGVPVAALVPDYLLLPRHSDGRCTLAADDQGRIVIRNRDLDGLVIGENELDLWWQEIDDPARPVAVNNRHHAARLMELGGTLVSEWDIGTQFPDWLQHGHQVPESANLLRQASGAGEAARAGRWLKVAAVLLGVALLLRLAVDAYEHVRLAAEERRLDGEIAATLQQAFPDITRVVRPRVQMEQRLRQLDAGAPGGDGFLALLSVVAQAVPDTGAVVEELTFRDGALLVTCRTDGFETLDRLIQRFSSRERIVAELVSSGSRDNSVSGRFRLGLDPGRRS